VTELPIVMVSSSWGTSLLGAIMLGLMLTAIVNWIRSGEAISAGTLAFMLCWIGVGFCFLPWAIPSQVRLEDKGIVQRAPFNFLVRDAEIAWTDIVSVEITVSHGLHTYVRSYGLAIIGKDGPVITLDPDGLPASFGTVAAEDIPGTRVAGERWRGHRRVARRRAQGTARVPRGCLDSRRARRATALTRLRPMTRRGDTRWRRARGRPQRRSSSAGGGAHRVS